MINQNEISKFWEDRTTIASCLAGTEKFRLLKYDNPNYPMLFPYALEVFSPAFGWEVGIDLSYSDLAELIELFNKYTEEK